MAKGIKTGGRKPGSLNKRTKAEAACHKFNLDPFEMLCEMARNAEQESNRLAAISKLCAHIEPPRKPVDIEAPGAEMVMYLSRYIDKK